MLCQGAAVGESLATVGAWMWPFTRVHSSVNRTVALLRKPLAAHVALERSCPRVHAQVYGQAVFVREILVALAT